MHRHTPSRKAFTLTELIVVVAIITLVLAFMVPVWNAVVGNRSVEAAQNQAAAFISTVRADGLYYREPVGVCFYIDPVSQQTTMAEVALTGGVDNTTGNSYVDFLSNNGNPPTILRDPEVLSKGVAVALYNTQSTSTDQVVRFGIIMFDQNGNVVPMPVAVQTTSFLGQRAQLATNLDPATNAYPNSSVGLILYDHELYQTYASGTVGAPSPDADYRVWTTSQSQPSIAEKNAEDAWILQNGISILLNQSNGTFVQGK